jgi:geranylgeranyl pyrophosphate synthase
MTALQPDLNTLRKKINQVFPTRDENDILAILEEYGKTAHETVRYRVYLAILKLCEEEKLPDPTHYVNRAKEDFRDVLAWAKYPNQIKFGPTDDPAKSAELNNKDLEQYQTWLNAD